MSHWSIVTSSLLILAPSVSESTPDHNPGHIISNTTLSVLGTKLELCSLDPLTGWFRWSFYFMMFNSPWVWVINLCLTYAGMDIVEQMRMITVYMWCVQQWPRTFYLLLNLEGTTCPVDEEDSQVYLRVIDGACVQGGGEKPASLVQLLE